MYAELPPRQQLPTGPYPAEQRGKLIMTVPVNEGHSIRIKWMIPALEPLWQESPDSFLSHLIGHEGKGSLFAELKAQGWARSLSAGGGRLLRGEGSFDIAVSLTDEGQILFLTLLTFR
jgi:insulysin